MKIIQTRLPICADCNGTGDKMLKICAVQYPAAFLCMGCAEDAMPIEIYLCLSCAQEAGDMAKLEQARESES